MRTPRTLGLTDGLTLALAETDGVAHGFASDGTHGVSDAVGETDGDGVEQGFAAVGTHGLGVEHGFVAVGTQGLGVEHGFDCVGTQGLGDGVDVGETDGVGVGAVQPVCAGFVFAMPLLPSHS